MSKQQDEQPVMGIPYAPNYPYQAPVHPQQFQQHHPYYVGENPYQAGVIPPNAVVGDPKGIPIRQTIYRDTPAPINCSFCGGSGVTTVRSKPSLAAVVGCMMPMMLGICFLCPSMDCLWHKYHYCPSCNEQLADFKKNDICAVMDPPQWQQESFALPA